MMGSELEQLLKDEAEHELPQSWREVFTQIVAQFVRDDFQLADLPRNLCALVDADLAADMKANVQAYGDSLAPLDESVWDRSVYRWMDGYWQVLVDLSTCSEAVSDLALHCRIEDSNPPRLSVNSIHVP
jgi:hypothetical protein